jgi:hypothetical protein
MLTMSPNSPKVFDRSSWWTNFDKCPTHNVVLQTTTQHSITHYSRSQISKHLPLKLSFLMVGNPRFFLSLSFSDSFSLALFLSLDLDLCRLDFDLDRDLRDRLSRSRLSRDRSRDLLLLLLLYRSSAGVGLRESPWSRVIT